MSPAAAAALPGPEAPLPRRLLAYMVERYPPVPMAVISATTVVSATLAAGVALERTRGVDLRLDLGVAVLAVAYFLTLFLLRILDEFKDFERDREAYPERVLSRGVVTLDTLRRTGLVVGLLAAAAAAPFGGVPLAAYAVVFVYALLMAKEFFVGERLEKDVFVYAVVHQPINPLITVWLYLAYAARSGLAGEELVVPPFAWYVGALFAFGFGFEVARKLWTPEEEQPELVDSYSSHPIGPRGAGLVALVLLLGGCALAGVFVHLHGLPAWVHAPIGAAGLLCLASVGRFAAAPFPGASKKLQGAVGLAALLVHGGLIAGILVGEEVATVAWLSL